MASVKQVVMDIQERLEDSGIRPDFDKIASQVGCPVNWVVNEFENMQQLDFGYFEEDY